MLNLTHFSIQQDGRFLVKTFDFSFPSLTVIMGPSGEGKTTFLHTLALLKKPSTGKILFNEKPLERKQVGLILQNFGLFSHLSTLENLTLALKLKSLPLNELDHYCTLFKLHPLLHKKPKNLSGGEKQRVAIVRMLLMNPEVVLYDEPTASLDEHFKIVLINLIKSFKNKTQIIISHDLYFVEGLHCPIYELKNGVFIHSNFKGF